MIYQVTAFSISKNIFLNSVTVQKWSNGVDNLSLRDNGKALSVEPPEMHLSIDATRM